MKSIRYALVIPAVFLAMGVVYYCFDLVIKWGMSLGLLWFLLLCGLLLFPVKFIAVLAVTLVSEISPDKRFNFWVVLILCVIDALSAIISSWVLNQGSVIATIIYNVLVLNLFYVLTNTAFIACRREGLNPFASTNYSA